MRISERSLFTAYSRNLDNVQNKHMKESMRLSTGQQILTLSDGPDKIVDIKTMTALIEQNKNYKEVVDQAVGEMTVAEEHLQSITDTFSEIRQIGIDATQTGSSGNTYTLGVYVKGMLQDILNDANANFNGKYLFSGTATTQDILGYDSNNNPIPPFELVQGEITADNPSGLSVVYHGNNEERIINKDSKSTEVININSTEMFGDSGTEYLNQVVDLYNLLSYNKDGTVRKIEDVFDREDVDKLGDIQGAIARYSDLVNNTTARAATRRVRMENVSYQMNEEITRLKDFRSLSSDADIARTTLNLKLEETALQYSLKAGSMMMQNSLFDFLS